jgi:hypothetical protein
VSNAARRHYSPTWVVFHYRFHHRQIWALVCSFPTRVTKFKMTNNVRVHCKAEMDDDTFLNKPYDLRFRNPSSFLLAGASQSGKTTFTLVHTCVHMCVAAYRVPHFRSRLNILRNIDTLFQNPSCKANVIYYYRQKQEHFKLFQQEGIVHRWINHLPTTAGIEEVTKLHQHTGSIIVIDDFAEALTRDTLLIFTTQVHHLNCVVILLAQNIFCKNGVFREISLNCTCVVLIHTRVHMCSLMFFSRYIAMFKNPRDASQINCFAKQIAPGVSDWVVNAFKAATRRPHSYLLFDTHQTTADILRVRSRVLPNELPMCVYRQKQY